jgi:hypothetical protein
MNTAKICRAAELLTSLRTEGWTNAQFWEAKQLMDSVSYSEGSDDEAFVSLLFAWSDIESDRIACGEHDGCDDLLASELDAKWPIRPTHNGRYYA